MAKYQAVIFDFDDTLVKAWEVIWAQHKHVAKKYYDIDLSDDKLAEHWGKPFEAMLGLLYSNADTFENMFKVYDSTKSAFRKELHDQSLATVDKLLQSDLQIGVVTSMLRDVIVADLKRLKFPVEKFAFVQGSDDTSYHKPDPRVFAPALKTFAEKGITDPGKIVYVGDAVTDYLAARDAGLGFVAVTTGRHQAEAFIKAGAKVVIKNIGELPHHVL